jgi:hypothetical protein
MTEEDEAFEAIDKAQGWRKRQIEQQLGQPIYFKPRREWVGLTEEQRFELAVKTGAMSADWLPFMEAVEAKLKELNHD